MATRDRRKFLPQALRCFLRQTYPNKELIVVDDSARSNAVLFRGVPGVRYLRLTQPTRTGTKLNLGIEAARGDILQKLDDDDFYQAGFLAASVAHLPVEAPESTLVTRCCFLVLLRGDPIIRHSGHGWTPGGAFCFHRALWTKTPFRQVRWSEDSLLLRDHEPEVVRICRPEQYMVVRHGANTWTRVTTGAADDLFRARPSCGKSLGEIVTATDLRFYSSLVRSQPASVPDRS
jgi:glycosyltransferase involved in cell wall biosynthesis